MLWGESSWISFHLWSLGTEINTSCDLASVLYYSISLKVLDPQYQDARFQRHKYVLIALSCIFAILIPQPAVAQSFPPPLSPPAPFPPKIIPSTPFPPKNTPPAPRLDRSRERYPRSSLEPSFVEISQHGPHRPDTNTNRSRSTSSRPIVPYDEQVRRLGLSPSTPGRDAAVFEQRHYSRRVDAPGAVPVERYERVVHRGREHVERRPSSSEERRQVRFSEDGL